MKHIYVSDRWQVVLGRMKLELEPLYKFTESVTESTIAVNQLICSESELSGQIPPVASFQMSVANSQPSVDIPVASPIVDTQFHPSEQNDVISQSVDTPEKFSSLHTVNMSQTSSVDPSSQALFLGEYRYMYLVALWRVKALFCTSMQEVYCLKLIIFGQKF